MQPIPVADFTVSNPADALVCLHDSFNYLLSDAELAEYENRTKPQRPVLPSRLRFAHTSPVYVTVNGQGARVERSLDELERLVAAFKTWSAKRAGPPYTAAVNQLVETAQRRLRDLRQGHAE